MSWVRLDEDIRPVTEFRTNAASLIDHVRRTKRTLVLTQRGRGAAVVVDVGEYERMVEEIELLRDVHKAEKQIAVEGGVPHDEARERALSALRP